MLQNRDKLIIFWTDFPPTNRNKINTFIKRIVTVDEEWVTYDLHTKTVVVESRSATENGDQAKIDIQ